jgi:hypothetical protein
MENNNLDNLNRILGTEEELVPSSGFTMSVMERLHEEAAALPPIPFPWKRIVPGMILAAGLLGWCGFELVRHGLPELHAVAQIQPHLPSAFAVPAEDIGWVAVALGLSVGSWLLSRRLVGRSGLL